MNLHMCVLVFLPGQVRQLLRRQADALHARLLRRRDRHGSLPARASEHRRLYEVPHEVPTEEIVNVYAIRTTFLVKNLLINVYFLPIRYSTNSCGQIYIFSIHDTFLLYFYQK
jgi:hypothetical protein